MNWSVDNGYRYAWTCCTGSTAPSSHTGGISGTVCCIGLSADYKHHTTGALDDVCAWERQGLRFGQALRVVLRVSSWWAKR
ncbi:hypothetical protein CGCFRS4_v015925 [Colletotrichum fructicola]|nr:hypothetical protein CGCFRS4_v015925 [Colletotrichum fructicola]